jgi:hypothetical protein
VTSSEQHPDSLHPALREAEDELTRLLRDACDAEARGVANDSVAEIRELEDALLAAAAAARHTLSLRRRVDAHEELATSVSRQPAAAAERRPSEPSTVSESAGGTVREFTDQQGRAWRAWPVTPGQTHTGRTKRFLGDYQLGWICFEGLHDSSRRRLAGHPPGWNQLSDRELASLLERSVAAKERKSAQPGSSEARPD